MKYWDMVNENQWDCVIDGLHNQLSWNSTGFTWCMTAENIFCSHCSFSQAIITLTCSGCFSPHSNTQMSTHTACYNRNDLNKRSPRPPERVPSTIVWGRYPRRVRRLPSGPATHSPAPVFLGDLPRLRHDRTGEDKLWPQRLGFLPCFHLHQQLISHHWRALVCQAEDFIRNVLYGL